MDKCPYNIGDTVWFKPSKNSKDWTPHRATWGLVDDEIYKILSIKDHIYLYVTENQPHGWHWKDSEIIK